VNLHPNFVVAILIHFAIPPNISLAATWYVNDDSSGNNNGTSWTDAFNDLQDGLAAANSGDQVWVAAGVYVPGATESDTFHLKNGVEIYGGFEGFPGTEGDFNVRDFETFVTVLSGDIDGDDMTNPNGIVTLADNVVGENTHHIVTGSGIDSTALLDGFIVTAGAAGSGFQQDHSGGGMHILGGSPTLTNLIFYGNSANYGGGLYNDQNSSPSLTNVVFSNNKARVGGGGGMHSVNDSSPTLFNVDFLNNESGFMGGGMYIYLDGLSTLTNVTFTGNTAHIGGGLSILYSGITLTNAIFMGNSASNAGGGLYDESDTSTLTDVVFANNEAEHFGGGMSTGGFGSHALFNVIFLKNIAGSNGGGMSTSAGTSFMNVMFTANHAAEDGGGLYNTGDATLANVSFSCNSAGENGGGIFNHGIPNLANVTFSGNAAGIAGGRFFNAHPPVGPTSTSSGLNCRVEFSEFDAGVVGCKAPVDPLSLCVS